MADFSRGTLRPETHNPSSFPVGIKLPAFYFQKQMDEEHSFRNYLRF